MNITEIQLCSVEVDAVIKTHATLSLRKTDRNNPYIIKSVSGLDVSEIVKTFNDGPKFFRVQPDKRIVSFLIALNPNYKESITVGDLRDDIYRAIEFNALSTDWNSESKLEIRFMNDAVYVASLFGTIVKFESNPFSIQNEIQITIECDFPFLRSNTAIDMDINIAPGLPDITAFNAVDYSVESTVSYNDTRSTSSHGFKMHIEVLDDVEQLIIWDNRNIPKYLFWVVYSFMAGDDIYFSSEEDDVYIYVLRSFVATALGDRYLWGSIWPYMRPGENLFLLSDKMRIVNGTFRETYWGI